MSADDVMFVLTALTAAMIGWGVLCHRSFLKRQLTVADLLALLLFIGVALGILSWL